MHCPVRDSNWRRLSSPRPGCCIREPQSRAPPGGPVLHSAHATLAAASITAVSPQPMPEITSGRSAAFSARRLRRRVPASYWIKPVLAERWIERMRHCETRDGPGHRACRGRSAWRCHRFGINDSGDKQWPSLLLHRLTHRMVIPVRNVQSFRPSFAVGAALLGAGPAEPRRGIGYILTQHQHRVRQLHFMQRWRTGRSFS